MPIPLNTNILSSPASSLHINRKDNKTVYFYDNNHCVVRWDTSEGKILSPYYKNPRPNQSLKKWIKGVDRLWLPFVPDNMTEGIYVGVEGEKCCTALNSLGVTSFTFALHCYEEKGINFGLHYLSQQEGFKGILYIADNDKTGLLKARKVELEARKLQIPHKVINIVDLWYYVTDDICFTGADVVDLLEKKSFNIKQLLCNTIMKT